MPRQHPLVFRDVLIRKDFTDLCAENFSGKELPTQIHFHLSILAFRTTRSSDISLTLSSHSCWKSSRIVSPLNASPAPLFSRITLYNRFSFFKKALNIPRSIFQGLPDFLDSVIAFNDDSGLGCDATSYTNKGNTSRCSIYVVLERYCTGLAIQGMIHREAYNMPSLWLLF